ncbi:MAG: recombinase family protein [Sphingomonadales bacterium]|nr:MAG: recombinase family protein [Sphingomonadales bacterium]
MLASIAEFETDIRKERQREGIERAKIAGVYKGRKPSVDVGTVRTLHQQGIGPNAQLPVNEEVLEIVDLRNPDGANRYAKRSFSPSTGNYSFGDRTSKPDQPWAQDPLM